MVLWCLPLLGFEVGYSVCQVAVEAGSLNRQDKYVVMWLGRVVRASRGFIALCLENAMCLYRYFVRTRREACSNGAGMPGMLINAPQTVRREASSAAFGREPGKWPFFGTQVMLHDFAL